MIIIMVVIIIIIIIIACCLGISQAVICIPSRSCLQNKVVLAFRAKARTATPSAAARKVAKKERQVRLASLLHREDSHGSRWEAAGEGSAGETRASGCMRCFAGFGSWSATC